MWPPVLSAAQPQGPPFTWKGNTVLWVGLAEIGTCAGLGVGSGAFPHSSLEWDSVQPFGTDILCLLSKLKTFSLDSAIPPLVICPTVIVRMRTQKCAQVCLLIEAPFVVATVVGDKLKACS